MDPYGFLPLTNDYHIAKSSDVNQNSFRDLHMPAHISLWIIMEQGRRPGEVNRHFRLRHLNDGSPYSPLYFNFLL